MPFALSNLISQSFPDSIIEKLDCSNYLHWRQHVEPVIKSHKLQQFVVNPVVPPYYLTKDDRIVDRVNPEYEPRKFKTKHFLFGCSLRFRSMCCQEF